ncbi:MAG: hypothetical protein L3J75_13585 [Methylococcaceae bacterium]|nr:hypothetical protein [Methylococcaceae bacterium]
MTFWSSQTLTEKLPTLISPCDPDRIEQASYTLRIGKEIYITKDQDSNDSQHTKRSLSEKQAFVIPSGQFAFLLTKETVKVPIDAIAFISMKAGFKYKGLINISGFHVDPGFEGKLLFSVYNAGPSSIHIAHDDPCFLIWYANLDHKDNKPRTKKGFSEIPMSVLNQISTDEVYSIQALVEKISKTESLLSDVKAKYESIKFWKSITWWLATAVIAIIINLVINIDTIYEHKKRFESYWTGASTTKSQSNNSNH